MITVSVASAAFRHPLLHAYCAIAEPSSCATLPKLNASLPLDPKRFGPIWSVPMHGATASTPRLIASCTTGAASSTSHVVMITFAPPSSRRMAHDFATSGLFPCVSHVCSWILRRRTPPLAFSCAIRSFAAARAGLSNGAIAPVLSNAQPITIGFGAEARSCADVAAIAVPIVVSATTAAATTVHLPRALMLLLPVVVLVVPYRLGDTCSTGARIRASQTCSNDRRARRASSAGATSHSESGHAL